jgi:hypothetical protein
MQFRRETEMRMALLVSMSTLLISLVLTNVAYSYGPYRWVSADAKKDCFTCGYASDHHADGGYHWTGSVSAKVQCGWPYKHTYAYAYAAWPGPVKIEKVSCWPPGKYAYAWAQATCPPGLGGEFITIDLPWEIEMEQIGNSSVFYSISIVDLNTTETIFYASANLTYGTFTVAGNWTYDQWIHKASSAILPPYRTSVPISPTHVYNETYTSGAMAEPEGEASLTSAPSVVGGFLVPVDKFGLLAPYIGLASTIIVATVATSIYVKHVKRRKEK